MQGQVTPERRRPAGQGAAGGLHSWPLEADRTTLGEAAGGARRSRSRAIPECVHFPPESEFIRAC